MMHYRKGEEARRHIIQEARRFYNQEGIHLTLEQLSKHMGLTKGKITNYFPTKDDLFIALSKDYDLKFQALMVSINWKDKISFEWLNGIISQIMDFQYEQRCTIIYIASVNNKQKKLFEQVSTSFKSNSQSLTTLLSLLINHELILQDILLPGKFEVFQFQFYNLMTTWVISLEIYDFSHDYAANKEIYLKGIISCFYPFLSEKGKIEIKKIGL